MIVLQTDAFLVIFFLCVNWMNVGEIKMFAIVAVMKMRMESEYHALYSAVIILINNFKVCNHHHYYYYAFVFILL